MISFGPRKLEILMRMFSKDRRRMMRIQILMQTTVEKNFGIDKDRQRCIYGDYYQCLEE